MTLRFALRSMATRPVRSAVLVFGFGFGIAERFAECQCDALPARVCLGPMMNVARGTEAYEFRVNASVARAGVIQ